MSSVTHVKELSLLLKFTAPSNIQEALPILIFLYPLAFFRPFLILLLLEINRLFLHVSLSPLFPNWALLLSFTVFQSRRV